MCTWARIGRFVLVFLALLTQIIFFGMFIAKLRTYDDLEWYFVFIPQFVVDIYAIILMFIRCCQCSIGDYSFCDEDSRTPAWGSGVFLNFIGVPLKVAVDVLMVLYTLNLVSFFIPAICLCLLLLLLGVTLLLYGSGLTQLIAYRVGNMDSSF